MMRESLSGQSDIGQSDIDQSQPTKLLQLANLPSGIFLVREDETGKGAALTVHTFDRAVTNKHDLLDRFPAHDRRGVRFSVHRPKALRSARSLAALARRFGGGPIKYDPTAIFTRMAEVVRCAGLIRAALGEKAGKIFFHSARRTVYVVLDDKAFEGNGLVFRAQVAQAMATAEKAVSAWKADAPVDFAIAVRMGFAPPRGLQLVAVDDESAPHRQFGLSRMGTRLRRAVGALAVGAVAAGAPSIAYAEDAGDPTAAVALPNLTLIGRGDYIQPSNASSGIYRGDAGAEGAVPLGHDFGVQAEAGIGSNSYYGGAGHLFWRDPTWGMIGGFVSDESLSSVSMARYGGEAELYLDRLTISGRGGYQSGSVQNGAFGQANLSFYATPTFVLRAGFEISPNVDFGRGGVEFQPAPESLAGLSLFADVEFGHGTNVEAGLKFHFGDSGSSLMYRDRHEDPPLAIFNMIALAAGAPSHYVAPRST